MISATPKIKYLDGLRGLAALMVFLNHFLTAFYPVLYWGLATPEKFRSGWGLFISGTFFNLIYNGNFAICLFFILSGYVLSQKFFREKKLTIISAGALKRYPRLFIPVFCSMILAFVLLKFSLLHNQEAAALSGSDWFLSLFSFRPGGKNFLYQAFFGVFFQHQSDYNLALWTMTYEFFGSFLVFAFSAIFLKIRKKSAFYLVLILFFLKTYYLAFALGILLSDLHARRHNIFQELENRQYFLWPLLALGIFLGSYPTNIATSGTIYGFFNIFGLSYLVILLHTLGAFLVMLTLLSSTRMQNFFAARPFNFLGKISFSFYLIHLIFICSFSSFLFVWLANYLPYNLNFLVTFAVTVPLLFILANLFYRFVDRPAIDFSRRLAGWLTKKN